MKFDNFTQKSQNIISSAQQFALAQGHQVFLPDHILHEMLADKEGFTARLIMMLAPMLQLPLPKISEF